MKIAIALGIVASLLMIPVAGFAAEGLPGIQGNVRDSAGTPVAGALVMVMTASSSIGERMAFTDSFGAFSIPNLLAGEYSVKVTMSRFLPALKNRIQLSTGTTAVLNLNLQTAMDVIRNVSGRSGKDSQDIVWILRSSRASQPVLRLAEKPQPENSTAADYSGYLQIYSKSVQSATGTNDLMESRFSVTMPLQRNARITVDGQFNESPDQPRGFGATYEFAPGRNHQSSVSVNMREGTVLNGRDRGDDLKEMQVKYGEKLQLTDHLVFNYGAETGRTAGKANDSYFRPTLGLSLVPNAQNAIGAVLTAEAPAHADDPIRGKDYFEQQAFLPPTRQAYRHAEVNASRIIGNTTKVSAAVFKDQAANQATFVQLPNGSKSFLLINGTSGPSRGARIHVDRDFKGFNAGLGYTIASGLGMSKPASTVNEVRENLAQRQFHVVTARIKTGVEYTNTEFTAVYRWISPLAAMSIDPYQTNVEYNDPTLSITVAQTLPTWGTFPGKVQAILDARNLLEQPVSNHGAQISNSPRFVKGGINIRF